MNIQEWMRRHEFEQVWRCLIDRWPVPQGAQVRYRDLFDMLRTLHIQPEITRNDSYIELFINAEGEIDDRCSVAAFCSTTSSAKNCDLWEMASRTVVKSEYDADFVELSDEEFAAALLRYLGERFLVSLPYRIPRLKNPFLTSASIFDSKAAGAKSRGERRRRGSLAACATNMARNWDLWYSECAGVTFRNKSVAMALKERFINAGCLHQLDVSFNPHDTSEVAAAVAKIRGWIDGRSTACLIMSVYANPGNRFSAEMIITWAEDMFSGVVPNQVYDPTIPADVMRLVIFASIRDKSRCGMKYKSNSWYGAIRFTPGGAIEF